MQNKFAIHVVTDYDEVSLERNIQQILDMEEGRYLTTGEEPSVQVSVSTVYSPVHTNVQYTATILVTRKNAE